MTTPDAGRTPRRDLLTFDRSDRWALGIALALVVTFVTVLNVVLPVLRWIDDKGIPIPFVSAVTVPELDAVSTRYSAADYLVTLEDPTTTQRVLDLVPGVLLVLIVVAGCWLVVSVMRTIAAGDPFADANVRRLRVLAGLLIIGPFLVFFLALPFQGALLAHVDLGGLGPSMRLDVPWPPLVAGFVVALLGEAFKAGSRMRADVEGLV